MILRIPGIVWMMLAVVGLDGSSQQRLLSTSHAWILGAASQGRRPATGWGTVLPSVPTTTTTTTTCRMSRAARTPPHDDDEEKEDDDDDDDKNRSIAEVDDDDDDDEDCDDEEECEIDWDTMMPPTDTVAIKEQLERQFAASAAAAASSITASSGSRNHNIPAIERHGDSSKTVTSNTLRHRLEMQWQVTDHLHDEECDVYQPASCGGLACTACQGRGHCICRFCQGTRQLMLRTIHDDGTVETSHVACQICNASGLEPCRACQGTGWVADWTGIGGGVHVGGGSSPTAGGSGGLLP